MKENGCSNSSLPNRRVLVSCFRFPFFEPQPCLHCHQTYYYWNEFDRLCGISWVWNASPCYFLSWFPFCFVLLGKPFRSIATTRRKKNSFRSFIRNGLFRILGSHVNHQDERWSILYIFYFPFFFTLFFFNTIFRVDVNWTVPVNVLPDGWIVPGPLLAPRLRRSYKTNYHLDSFFLSLSPFPFSFFHILPPSIFYLFGRPEALRLNRLWYRSQGEETKKRQLQPHCSPSLIYSHIQLWSMRLPAIIAGLALVLPSVLVAQAQRVVGYYGKVA